MPKSHSGCNHSMSAPIYHIHLTLLYLSSNKINEKVPLLHIYPHKTLTHKLLNGISRNTSVQPFSVCLFVCFSDTSVLSIQIGCCDDGVGFSEKAKRRFVAVFRIIFPSMSERTTGGAELVEHITQQLKENITNITKITSVRFKENITKAKINLQSLEDA